MKKLNDLIGEYVHLKETIDTLEEAQEIGYSEKTAKDIIKYKEELLELHSKITKLKEVN